MATLAMQGARAGTSLFLVAPDPAAVMKEKPAPRPPIDSGEVTRKAIEEARARDVKLGQVKVEATA
jgi:hypothetical protein